jgi:hypothetical protein
MVLPVASSMQNRGHFGERGDWEGSPSATPRYLVAHERRPTRAAAGLPDAGSQLVSGVAVVALAWSAPGRD